MNVPAGFAAPHFLLVDDDAVFRERLAMALRARGARVDTAGDAAAALALPADVEPVAALIDLRMPGGGGIPLIRALLSARPGLRVVVLTGYGSIATAIEAVRAGAADYLTKPADAGAIYAALIGSPLARVAAAEVSTLQRLEWEHIQRVLTQTGGNVSETARLLGIDRRSLQRKLAKLAPRR